MKRGTSNLKFETVAMDEFPLKWRFTDPLHHQLPPDHLGQVRPLAAADARRLRSITRQSGMFSDIPFTQGYFRSVTSTLISTVEDQAREDARIRKWLYRLGVPFQREVFLSYEPEWAIETNWKLLVKYWSAFYYPGSDDLIVVDGSSTWALLFHHDEQIFYGSNMERRPSLLQG